MIVLTHEYTPRGACARIFDARDPEVLISGPSGTGKSRACLEKLHTMAMVNPGLRGLMIRKAAVSLTYSGLVTWRRDVIPESEERGLVSFYGGSSEEPAQYRYHNGSSVVIGGMDKASKIMSSEYDIIYVQEATELTEDDWEALTTRLRSGMVSFQQIIGDCNPSHEMHWLKLRCNSGQTLMLRSRHEDNPLLYDADGQMTEQGKDYMARLGSLTGVRKRRLKDGEWSSAEGVVYEGFDSAVHLVDWFSPPDDWPRYWAVDFGFTNPFVCQFWAEDSDGRVYLYREWFRTKLTVEEHGRQILDLVTRGGEWIEPKPKAVICDHDADREGETLRARFGKTIGLSTRAAHKKLGEGVQAVQERLKVQQDGKPRLMLMRGALVEPDPLLIESGKPTWSGDEIAGYVWDARPDHPPKETPVKKDDHGMDAMRYLIAYRDLERPGKARMSQTTERIPDRIG